MSFLVDILTLAVTGFRLLGMVNKAIFLIGPMGSGKSTVGKKLSDLLCLRFLDSDQILASRHNSTIAHIFNTRGEVYFREQEQLLLHELTQSHNTILATGGGCILREETRATLARGGLVCYLSVNPLQQVQRTLISEHRPTLPSNVPEQLSFFQEMHSKRSKLYESIAHISIDTNCIDSDTVASMLFENIKKYDENN